MLLISFRSTALFQGFAIAHHADRRHERFAPLPIACRVMVSRLWSIIVAYSNFKVFLEFLRLTMDFYEFDFEPVVFDGIDAMGYVNATPIQEQTIPAIQTGKDVIGCAQTGTGKTAAFLLPVINELASDPSRPKRIYTVILSPTRELAQQIDRQIDAFGYFTGVGSLSIYGGGAAKDWDKQRQALRQGADIIVAAPGRLLSHLRLKTTKLEHVEYFILDEADRLLQMGFQEDIMEIISYLPKERQNLFFSATMPKEIRTFARKILNNPIEVNIAVSNTAEGITQRAFYTPDNKKIEKIISLLKESDRLEYSSIIIFAGRKKTVREVNAAFRKHKIESAMISSDLDQDQRNEVLRKFANKSLKIIVSTDVLSRGIDIQDIDLVINYDVPNDVEDYVHRVGRTARAASKGEAITLVNSNDKRIFKQVVDHVGDDRIEHNIQLNNQSSNKGKLSNRNRQSKRSTKNRNNRPSKNNKS